MRIRNENLKAYLDENKGAASKLAAKLGVNKSLVSHWKTGTERVPVEYTEMICKELGRTVDDLCKPFSSFHLTLPDTPEMHMLAKVAPNLSESGLNQVLVLALQLQQSELK